MWLTLLACLAGASPDTTFPEWRKPAATDSTSTAAKPPVAPPQQEPGWIVERQHPALGRDSTLTIELTENPVATVLLWPFDHILRPTVRMALMPFHSAVDYGENNNVVDRGLRLVHPTGDENVWFYPVTTLDGTDGSRWGLVYLDHDFLSRGWTFRSSGAVSVAQNASGRVEVRTSPFLPLGIGLRAETFAGRSRDMTIRVPGEVDVSDPTVTGGVSLEKVGADVGILGKGVRGSWWDLTYNWTQNWAGLPARQDQELPPLDSMPWFRDGPRGTKGTETDQTISIGAGWSDQNMAGAPTSGGPTWGRFWTTFADEGGSVSGIDVSSTRCFLLGNQRYVYRVEDLRPYLDLDPREIVRILDPTTLMERLTQRKILVVSFRYTHIWQPDPTGAPPSFFLYPNLGGDSPARAYPSGYLLDKTVGGGSLEYRWPIWKYLDGVAFTELAWSSPGWIAESPGKLAPGAGGGFRARLDRLFLFRGYLAWGRAGAQYSLTTSSEF
ncbi:MAG TPA: hypothetical protein VN931_02535 [Fibrobacteria bacterium]|nr:hypothetical protein [Fibrobacteria bacterium]